VLPERRRRIVDNFFESAVRPDLAVSHQGRPLGRAFRPWPENPVEPLRQTSQQLPCSALDM